ncbi:unnamed protein product [Darwinula stevensoni]|uniref:LRAT domain-containing protein n=1 Tax=Darwinula stevensoni TaxID=69355 RepID=A0A7R9AF58_9CRUS|nr:unnamed protein product [Darwinula stevensoni]CAG0902971.1 unnamed protein product [Darwinula stevensoni]
MDWAMARYGDKLTFRTPFYDHEGVLVPGPGGPHVIERVNPGWGMSRGCSSGGSGSSVYAARECIVKRPLGKEEKVIATPPKVPPQQAIAMAEKKYQNRNKEGPYDLFSNNCEHLARECTEGRKYSKQVDNGVKAAVAIGAVATASIVAYRALAPASARRGN